jgi:hydroxymethylbilane synthase
MDVSVTLGSQGLPRELVIATRESALALWQAQHVQALLLQLYPSLKVSLLSMSTQGDRLLGSSLAKIGGKGLFVKELERSLEQGRAHIAVHSLKDVPMQLPQGFCLAALLPRADPRDAFVSNNFDSLGALPPGARVGTSSLRRESQLRAKWPHLKILPLRGNVQTRLRKLDEQDYEAIILATAGLVRLGLESRIREILTPEQMLPAVGQGALAIECLQAEEGLCRLLAPLNDTHTADCVNAERALSRALAGSCNVPLAGFAQIEQGQLRLRAYVGLPDGTRHVVGHCTGPTTEAERLGQQLANELRAQGAGDILAAVEQG